jgi:hypothetical protein
MSTSMYLNTEVKAPQKLKIYLPHLAEPIPAKKVVKLYPKFAKLFDGESYENTLFYYYKLNKAEFALEFEDENAEAEVAELLNVKIIDDVIEEKEEEIVEDNAQLSENQIKKFKEDIEDIRRLQELI